MPKVVPEYKAQARARIVTAARAVFRRKGFRGATMEDIANEIEVSKGALYLYFRTKAELLGEIQSEARGEVLHLWEQLLDSGDVAEGMANSLDQVGERPRGSESDPPGSAGRLEDDAGVSP